MDQETLKARQAPIKQQYRTDPQAAVAVLRAEGIVDFGVVGCRVALPPHNSTDITAGLHPKAGGDGTQACSGDMLLQSLVTCAGTTLAAVGISMGLHVTEARVEAIGTMDFRGTMGVDRTVPIGFTEIEVLFHIQSPAETEQLEKLIQLTERYCVVFQTLTKGVALRSRRVITESAN